MTEQKTPRTDAAVSILEDNNNFCDCGNYSRITELREESEKLEIELTSMTSDARSFTSQTVALRKQLTAALSDVIRYKAQVESRDWMLDEQKTAIKRRDKVLAMIAKGEMYCGSGNCDCKICVNEREAWVAAKLKEAT